MTKRVAFILIAVLAGMFVIAVTTSGNDDSKKPQATTIAPPAEPEKPLTPEEKKKAAALTEKLEEQLRIQYAKSTEDNMLENGFNVDVTAYGPKHKYLKLKWALANKVVAFKFSHDHPEMFDAMRKEGFTRFEISDGYDFGWKWDLDQ